MTIKHLSLCGGGIVGLVMYGILKRLHQLKFWEQKNIETIYSCSVGSVIGLLIILDIDWLWLDDFWIKRPWKNIFDFNNIDYFRYINEKGIFDESTWIKIITPLLKSNKLKTDITLLELYNYKNIEFNLYVTELNDINKKILNYKTYPDMRLTYAIYLTTCIPYICKPAFFNGIFYVDGGLTNNVPINDCISNNNCNPDEIINITNEVSDNINFSLDTLYNIDNSIDEYIRKNIENSDEKGEKEQKIAEEEKVDDREETVEIEEKEEPTEKEKEKENIEEREKKEDNHEKDNDEKDNDEKNNDEKNNDEKDNSQEIVSNNTTSKEENQKDIEKEKLNSTITEIVNSDINEECNIFQFGLYLLKKLVQKIIVLNTINNISVKNSFNSCITKTNVNIELWINIIYSSNNIKNTINYGCKLADDFYRKNYMD